MLGIMSRKKILIISTCFLLGILFVGTLVLFNRQYTRVEKNGFSFRYHNNLTLQEIPSTEGNYANYQISSPDALTAKSSITISIPIKTQALNLGY